MAQRLTEHLDITKVQATRLENVLDTLGEKAKGEKCHGIEGAIDEGSDLTISLTPMSATLRLSLRRSVLSTMKWPDTAQHVVLQLFLGDDEASKLLQQTLDEGRRSQNRSM